MIIFYANIKTAISHNKELTKKKQYEKIIILILFSVVSQIVNSKVQHEIILRTLFSTKYE